ncbi:DUF4304 domain-containing protein [Halocynthiibacter styelae]|uniref:DUF4304 domain-containing protein n=1 Tax=Halocynthiibacter styelae TaxID=2761955 RepID=A0A8J7LJ63_9RHOB|nr:DUF4304 domain-containing protein [Paenihalocynthiibacter styelae]MBI1492095.1 DUF4304 domain-containing protein [Paenihalocynthiibacter styelae]
MELALKEVCVPALRTLGFKGSFPHFYKNSDGFVELITFQFFSAGGSFCVNLGYVDFEGKNVSLGQDTEISKLRVSSTKDFRRMGAVADGDRWFCFGSTSYGTRRGQPFSVKELAEHCSALFKTDAEIWWRSKKDAECEAVATDIDPTP